MLITITLTITLALAAVAVLAALRDARRSDPDAGVDMAGQGREPGDDFQAVRQATLKAWMEV